ncbi:MAG: DegV family protein [Bacilli bacterium]|nr:DegV family protein [Bacilli bacterium]
MKYDYVIFTDAGACLTRDVREKYGIEEQPKSTIVWPNGEEKVNDIEWENITPKQFFTLMTNKRNNFASSIPAPQTVVDRLMAYGEQGLNVIVFTISSTMSGGFSEYTVAAQEVKEKYPNIKIEVIDTLRYGPAEDLAAIEASRCREKGMSFEETVAYMREAVLRIHQCGVLDDLFFLARKGRLSKGVAFMGNMVGIKPMADLCNETGLSEVIGKARGYKKLLRILPKFIDRTIGSYKDKVFVIENSLREDLAEKFKEIVVERYNPEHLIMGSISQSTGVNVGPGLCAVYYIADAPVSPHCEKEKAILDELLKQK